MNRRTILAGVLAVALLAATVVLITAGGGGEDVAAIKGQPFRGQAGITRSVADIRADQLYLDRHPEIERERTRKLAAGEAAREAAAEEPGQEANEPAAGEHAAESGTEIVEKPEPPGEERMPPKEPADSSRAQQRVGSAAIGPRQAVDPSTSFLGAQSNESGFIPPDSMGAVGPSQVLVF